MSCLGVTSSDESVLISRWLHIRCCTWPCLAIAAQQGAAHPAYTYADQLHHRHSDVLLRCCSRQMDAGQVLGQGLQSLVARGTAVISGTQGSQRIN